MYDMQNNSTKITAFCCNWSVHPGMHLSNLPQEEDKAIVTMCSGRLNPELIIQAFEHGASGVLICACSPGECEHDGNYKTLRRVIILKKMLKQLNIEPERIKLEWVDTGESIKVKDRIDTFYDEMKELGPIKYGKE